MSWEESEYYQNYLKAYTWKEKEPKTFAPDGKLYLGDIKGSVYFIQDDVMNLVKIGAHLGMAAPSYEISTRTYFDTKAVFVIPSCNHYFTENLFHKYFAEKRFKGEWFTLTNDDIEWIRTKEYPDVIWQSILDPNFYIPANKRGAIIKHIDKHWHTS
jgi:hypothetical protein